MEWACVFTQGHVDVIFLKLQDFSELSAFRILT